MNRKERRKKRKIEKKDKKVKRKKRKERKEIQIIINQMVWSRKNSRPWTLQRKKLDKNVKNAILILINVRKM